MDSKESGKRIVIGNILFVLSVILFGFLFEVLVITLIFYYVIGVKSFDHSLFIGSTGWTLVLCLLPIFFNENPSLYWFLEKVDVKVKVLVNRCLDWFHIF